MSISSREATQRAIKDTMVPIFLSKILEVGKSCLLLDKNDIDLRYCVAMGNDRVDT